MMNLSDYHDFNLEVDVDLNDDKDAAGSDDRFLIELEEDLDHADPEVTYKYVVPTIWIPIYAIFISIWSTYFLEKWNRR